MWKCAWLLLRLLALRLRLRLRLRPGVGAVADGLRVADLRGTCHAHERVLRHKQGIDAVPDDRPCGESILGFHFQKRSHGALAHLPAHGWRSCTDIWSAIIAAGPYRMCLTVDAWAEVTSGLEASLCLRRRGRGEVGLSNGRARRRS